MPKETRLIPDDTILRALWNPQRDPAKDTLAWGRLGQLWPDVDVEKLKHANPGARPTYIKSVLRIP